MTGTGRRRSADRLIARARPAVRLCAGLLLAAGAAAADSLEAERALWRLWRQHLDRPDRHEETAAECARFAAAHADNPLRHVALGIAGWRLLSGGRVPEARGSFAAMETPLADPLSRAAVAMSRRWLTRLDREEVKDALRQYYARRIEYPAALDALADVPGLRQPPAADRWERPWRYRLASFRRLSGVEGQRYELRSTMIDGEQDLAAALAVPYASRIRIEPAGMRAWSGGRMAVEFTSPAAPETRIYLSPGDAADGLELAHLGARILVLSDGDHWRLAPRPE